MPERPRILVPQPIRPEGLAMLREAGDVELIEHDRMLSHDELTAALRRNDYVLAIGDVHLTGEVMDANPDLRGIAFAAGHPGEWMDIDAATERGIPVTEISRGPVTETTAELTMALLLGVAWRLLEADRYTRAGRFRQEQSTLLMSHTVAGKTLGLVGLGGVGRLVAERARGFGLRMLYTKRRRLEPEEERRLGVEWVADLDELLRESDFVSLHVSHNPSSEKLIGRRELELMKPTAFLINTARGRIVDEPALIEALQERKIAGAALDVFAREPLEEDSPLFKLDNVILTPHSAGWTDNFARKTAESISTTIRSIMNGELPANTVNRRELEASGVTPRYLRYRAHQQA